MNINYCTCIQLVSRLVLSNYEEEVPVWLFLSLQPSTATSTLAMLLELSMTLTMVQTYYAVRKIPPSLAKKADISRLL